MLVVAGTVSGGLQSLLWVAAIAVDYAVVFALIPLAVRTTAVVGLATLTVLFVGRSGYETLFSEHGRRIRAA